MKRHLHFFLCLILMGISSLSIAKEVSQQQAMTVARNLLTERLGVMQHDKPGIDLVLLTSRLADQHCLYYIFNTVDLSGWVIISADDRIPPVLAYGLSGGYELNNPPPAEQFFLSGLEKQMLWLLKNQTDGYPETMEQWQQYTRDPFIPLQNIPEVSPMITAMWHQGCFYNNQCPPDNSATNYCFHALTGCGATAMAQIMQYYHAPDHGTGQHSYIHPVYGNLSANFGATTYNWSAMPNSLTANNDAVATLMYHCGVAQDMNYGPDGSSSNALVIDGAFINYFDYSSTANWKWRSDYTANAWAAAVRTELDAGRPLFYYGNDNGTNGHFFNCDGYQGSDYFHFNWGWSGNNNGYFYLNNLNPGGYYFTDTQGAIFNLYPNHPVPVDFTMDFENIADFSLTFNNWTPVDVDGQNTYGIQDHTFLHQTEPMAFICFNPSQVSPAMTDQGIQPHGGQKFGACFAANPAPNNDWFISPKIQLSTNGEFSFWVKSYTDQYGLEKFKVAVSTTDLNPASFTVISGTQPLEAPITWTKKTFSLAAYNNQDVYIGIQCVSNDAFILMIDDLEVKPGGSSTIVADFSASKTQLRLHESINFTDLSTGNPTSWSWSFQGATPATSNLQHPANIQYNTAGTFDVSLTASDGTSGNTETKTGYITVTGYPSSMSLDFESPEDFSLTFDPWTVNDVGGGATYGISGISFLHSGEPMAWICFNPSATTPPEPYMTPHSGNKLGCSFATMPPHNPNDKWLISPKLSLANTPTIDFWVQTYNTNYGYELFNVGISTTDNDPAHFTRINQTVESAPASWTRKAYTLNNYANQDVYIGIQCVSNDIFILMIDDISINSVLGMPEEDPLNELILYPNPVSDYVYLKFSQPVAEGINIVLLNTLGQTVKLFSETNVQHAMRLELGDLPGGMYSLRIQKGKYNYFRKISIVK